MLLEKKKGEIRETAKVSSRERGKISIGGQLKKGKIRGEKNKGRGYRIAERRGVLKGNGRKGGKE